MKSPKNTTLYSRLALATSVTLVVGYFVVYAAWTSISDVTGGQTLTATLINNILGNLTDLNDRVSNFGFSSGNVGIGMTNPVTKFGVKQTENTAVTSTSFWNALFGGIDIQNPSTTANTIAGIRFLNQDGVSGIGSIQESSTLSALAFFAGGSGRASTVPERMRITSNGDVGIGTTAPAAKLHVAGNMRLNSNTIRQIAPQVSTVYTDGASAAYGYCSFTQGVLNQAKAGCTVTLRQNAYGTAIVSGGTMVDSVNYIYRIYGAYSGQVTCICMEWE